MQGRVRSSAVPGEGKDVIGLLELLLLGCLGFSLCYTLLTLLSLSTFFRHPPFLSEELPPVSLLIPVKGIDPQMYENFETLCTQSYPCYEVIFGLMDPQDPARTLIETLIASHPQQDIRLVISDRKIGRNNKINNLYNMWREAKYEVIVCNDSDIRVQSDYLRHIVSPLQDRRVGMVTCPYRARGEGTIFSKIQAIGVNTEFLPSVIVAHQLEGLSFALGAAIATRRHILQEIGGFQALADYLADDYHLGYKIRQHGYTLYLTRYLVDLWVHQHDFQKFFLQQVRWARTIRNCRPTGYFFYGLTNGTVLATLYLLLNDFSRSSFFLWIFFLSLRLSAALFIHCRYLGERPPLRSYIFLFLCKEFFSFLFWSVSFMGNRVFWRGERYRITAEGKLV
ncbi:MAG: glycosyltransferase [Nitrospinota bacterium]|nr:MAG: glycosyltransferase [Nitrospinota bacterium]